MAAIATALGLVHYLVTPLQYRATTVLQIGQRSAISLSSDFNPWFEAWLSVRYFPTQYRLLKSRGMAERVVTNLRLFDDPAFNPERGGVRGTEASAAADEAQIAALANRIVANLSVDPITETELVTLTYVASDPQLAARIVNGIANAYIEWGIEAHSVAVDKTARFLHSEVENLKTEIQEKERQLGDSSRAPEMVSLDSGSNLTMQRLEKLNADLSAVVRNRIELEAQRRQLADTPRQAVAERDPLIATMQQDLLKLENEYQKKLAVYKPDWPDMIELERRIGAARAALEAALERRFGDESQKLAAELQSARRRERSLEQEIERTMSEALDLNQASVELGNLRMEIENKRKLQDELLRQLSETGLSGRLSGERESNIRVVDRALVPGAPFRPSLRTDLALGLGSGLIFGISLVFLIHFLDRTVKSGEQLERLTGLPVLAVVPDLASGGGRYGYRTYRYGEPARQEVSTDAVPEIELLPSTQPRLAVSEAYRSMRTAILLSTADKLASIAITSAEAGEGKTASVANLAVVMAQLGKRVLVVDADLRKPRMHKILRVSNRTGLVNHLTAGEPPEELIVAAGVPNLWVIPSGAHPPNPSELLASARMVEFVEEMEAQFDMVIVDTPPVLAVTDAVVMGTVVDGMVLCFQSNRVMREDIRACCDRLERAGVRVLGTVLNRYRPAAGAAYGRRYRYYAAAYDEGEDHVADSAA